MLWWLLVGYAVLKAAAPARRIGAARLIESQTIPKVAGVQLDRPATISVENGWEPVWVKAANTSTLRWGFCIWDLIQAQTEARMYDESKFVRRIGQLIGEGFERVLSIVKAATANISLCVRMEIPAAHFDLQDGRAFWIPAEPEGGGLHENEIVGWNPGSTRPGFPATMAPWPLGEMPQDMIAAAWLKNLGDIWGWGKWGKPVRVYQLIVGQSGVLKSFPCMTKQEWRTALLFGGETYDGGEIYTGGIVKWFKAWRASGQRWKLYPARRSKAMPEFD